MTSLWQEGDALSPTNLNTKIQSVITTSITTVVVPSVNTTNAVFSVVDYGADPLGATDSTSAITAAISAASANNGGIVYFPAGSYKFNSTIQVVPRLTGSITLVGAGMRASFLKPTASVITAVLMGSATTSVAGDSSKNIQYCGIENLDVDCSSLTTTGVGIQFTQMQKGWMRNVLIENLPHNTNSIGLFLRGSDSTVNGVTAPHTWRCLFENVLIAEVQQPLVLQNADENDFVSCNLHCPPGLTSKTTAFTQYQGRNNRFFGLLLGGETSSLTTGRPNYVGMHMKAPTNNGDTINTQVYGLVAEGFDTAVLYDNNTFGHIISGYNGSICSSFYSDGGGRTVLLAPYHTSQLWPESTASQPTFAFSEESTLGLFRSAASTIALSYGTFYLQQDGHLALRSGGNLTDPPFKFFDNSDASTGLSWAAIGQMNVASQGTLAARFGTTAGQGWLMLTQGSATTPSLQYFEEPALGLYRSGSSTIALSYGTLNLRGGILSSIRSTNASATSATLNDGEFRIAAVSTTSAELAYRSGNTTYRFIADATAL